MSPDAVFNLGNALALVGWALLLVAPRWRWSAPVIGGAVIPLLLAGIYLAIILTHLGEGRGDFRSVDGIAALFSDRWTLVAGWMHYLAFDLFVGAWEVRDSARERIPHAAVVPCLILTFGLGPLGLALYLLIREGVRLARRRATFRTGRQNSEI